MKTRNFYPQPAANKDLAVKTGKGGMRLMKQIVCLLLFSAISFVSSATTWYSQGTSDPTVLANWNSATDGSGSTPGNFTTPGDIWTIQSNMTSSTAWSITGSLVLAPGGTLAVGTTVIYIGGDWTNNSSATAYTSSYPASVFMEGTVAQNINGSFGTAFASVVISNSAGVTLGVTTTFGVGSVLYLDNGTLNNTASNLIMSCGSFVYIDNGTLAVTPTSYCTTLDYLDFEFNQLTLTVGNEWPSDFTGDVIINHSGATISLNGDKTAASLSIASGALNANSHNIALTGDWTNNSASTAFTAGTGTVTFNGSGAQGISGSFGSNFYNLTINSSGVTVTSGASVYKSLNLVQGELNNGSGLTMSAGTTMNVDQGTLGAGIPTQVYNIVYTNLGVGGDYTTGNELAPNPLGNVTVNKVGSTITLGASTSLAGASPYGNITLTAGTLSASSYTLSLNGNWTNNSGTSAFNAGTGLVQLFGSSAQTISGATNFYNLTIDNTSGGVTLSSAATVYGSLNLEAGELNNGANLTMNSGTNVNVDEGTLQNTPSSYTVNLTYENLGVGGDYATGAELPISFAGNIIVNKPGNTITLGTSVNLFGTTPTYGNITLSGGTLSDASYAINIKGNWTNNAGTTAFDPGTSQVAFEGTSAESISGSYATNFYALLIANSAGVTCNAGVNIPVAGSLNLGVGELSNTANLALASGTTVNVDGGTLDAVPGNTTYNLDYEDIIGLYRSITTGNEFPPTLNGSLTINKFATSGVVTLNGGRTVSGDVTLTAGSLDVSGSNYGLTLTGNWANNGGTFVPENGTVDFDGSVAQTIGGSTGTSFYNLTMDNTSSGTSVFNALTSVYNTTTITTGNVNANNDLYIRSDAGPATMVNNGSLTGNVQGLIASASVTSGVSDYTSNLSVNISGSSMAYQWQSSPDNITWTNVAGATNATYTATVTATVYYRSNLTTTNTAYTESTPGVELPFTNTPPTFNYGSPQVLTVVENASATSINTLLAVSDVDIDQTETWTQFAAPAHGTLTITSATASSGGTDIMPGGTITYAPAAGYSGPDVFTIQVSDGYATANMVINVTVIPDPVVSLSGACVDSVLTVTSNITPYQIAWMNGVTTYTTTMASWSSTGTVAAANGIADNGLNYITIDTSGDLYVAVNGIVVMYPPNSNSGTSPTVVAENNVNYAVAARLDAQSNLYVADNAGAQILEFAPGSNSSTNGTVVAANGLFSPQDVFVDAAGNIYVAEGAAGYVIKYPPGSNGSTTGTIVAQNGIGNPVGVFVDGSGNIFVSDPGNSEVWEFPPTSNASTSGTVVAQTGLTQPQGIYVDGQENLYVADGSSDNIFEYPAGSNSGTTPVTLATTTALENGRPTQPVLDANGNLYVGDNGANDILKFANTISMTSVPTSAGNYTAVVSTFAGGMATTNVVSVNITPSVNAVPGQVVCNNASTTVDFTGTSVPGTMFTWTNNNSSIGLATTGTGNIGPFTITNSGTVTDSAVFIVTPSIYGCVGAPDTFSIVVNPTPNVSEIPSQTLCNGVATTQVDWSSAVSGTTFSWTNSNTATGLAASGTGDSIISFTATNSTSAPITGTVTVTPVASTCTGPTQSFSITVNPSPTVAAIANQTLCDNTNTDAVTFSGTVSGTTFTWANNNTSIGLGAGSTSTGIPSFEVANTTDTTVSATIVVSPSANGCIGLPTGFSINVYPEPTETIPGDKHLCNGSTTGNLDFTGAVDGTTFTWTNSNTSIGLAASGTGNIPSFTVTNTGTTTQFATIDVTPSANGCTGVTRHFTLYVHPTPTVAQPGNQTLCNNSPTTAVDFTGTVGFTHYSWTNTNTTIGLGASGTGNIGSFTATNGTDVIDTGIITVTPDASGCIGTAKNFLIIVNPTPTETIPGNMHLCNGSTTGDLDFTGPVSGTLYSWTNTNSSIGLASTGTGSISSFTVTNTGTTTQIATIAVTPSANGCTGTTESFTLYVHPTPTVGVPANKTVCNHTFINTIHFTGTVGGTNYTWTNSNTTIGLGASGFRDIHSFTATNDTDVIDTAVITVTPDASGCTGTAESFLIIVNPTPTVVANDDTTVCNGTSYTVNFTGSVSGTSYVWTNSNSGIGLASSGTNTTSFTTMSGTNIADTGTIIVIPEANGCNGIPDTFTISVNPTPTVAATDDTALCNGTPYSVTFGGSLVAGTTYAWTNNNTIIGLAASGTDTTGSFTATSGGSAIDTATVMVTPWANGCSGITDTFDIVVFPTPNVTVPHSEPVCNGAATGNLDFTGSVSGTLYSWTNTNSSIGLVSTGTGSITSFIATNPGTTTQIATIAVTPSANGCTGTTESFTLYVHPSPTVVVPADTTVCNNTPIDTIRFTGAVDFTQYSWTNSNTTIGLGASGFRRIDSFTAINSTNVIDTAVITVTPEAHGCTGTAESFLIIVNPTPTVVANDDTTICNGVSYTVNFAGSVSGSSYVWTNSNSGIGLASSGTNTSSFTATSDSHIADTGTIIVIPEANGCNGIPDTFTISVNPTPNVAPTDDTTLCNGAVYSHTFGGSLVAATSYSWTNNNTIIGLGASGTDTTGTFTATNSSTVIDTATIMVTPWASGCSGIADTFSIVVFPTPMLVNPLTPYVQCDSMVFMYADTSLTAGTTYAWSMPSISGISAPATSGIDSINEMIVNSNTNPVAVTFVYTLTANGCKNMQDVVVTVNPTPQLANPTTVFGQCNNMVFTYVPSSLTGDSSFTWVRLYAAGLDSLAGSGTGAINDLLINTTTANVIDTYIYTISAYGCVGQELLQVTVHPTPVLSSDTILPQVCSGQPFSYTPESLTGPIAYSWIRDTVSGISPVTSSGIDSINETLTNSSTTPQVVTYIYTLSAYGCTNTENVYLTVNPLPGAPVITTYVSDVCDNAQYQNFGVAIPPASGESYAWTASAGTTVPDVGSNGQYCIVNFDESGSATVTVTGTIDGTGCNSSSSIAVTVGSGTAGQPYVVYSFGEFVCLENNVTSYQWGYDNKASLDSTLLVGQINQNYANSNPDTIHNYYWVITGQNGCFMKSYYNGPSSTGISNVNDGSTDVKVYPNPTSDNINVEINTTVPGAVTVQLSDMLGQKINEVPAADNKAVIDVSKLASGVYVIDCFRDGIKIAAAKFIKN